MPAAKQLYPFILALSGSFSVLVASFAWRRRLSPGGMTLTLLMAALAAWSWLYALHWLFPHSPAPFFWLDATYIGVTTAPPLYLIFALQITGSGGWLTRERLALLFLLPLLTIIILWTEPYHGLFFAGKRTAISGAILSGGLWFWVTVLYTYLMMGAGLVVLISGLKQIEPGIYRSQIATALIGGLAPWVSSAIGIWGKSPLPNLDLTPLSFTFTGVFLLYGMVRLRLLDLIPIPYDVMIDHLKDGLALLDARGRVIMLNNPAQQMLGLHAPIPTGLPPEHVLYQWPALVQVCRHFGGTLAETELPFGDSQTMHVQDIPFFDSRGALKGRLITWRDISVLKQAEAELRAQLHTIEQLQNTLREQAIRDPLTELYNRRYLQEALAHEQARADRKGYSISFLLIDADHFKLVNDRCGHDTGDIILRALANLFVLETRKGDLVFRYGGEEFLIVLVDLQADVAGQRADQLRRKVEATSFHAGAYYVSLTVSIGVSAYPTHGFTIDTALHAADTALYSAKGNGRNQVQIAVVE